MQIIILKIILDSNDGIMLSCMELIKMEFLISKELIRDYRIGKLGTSFKNQGRIQKWNDYLERPLDICRGQSAPKSTSPRPSQTRTQDFKDLGQL